jgi:HAD superfamily hydrolase (TIGR01509 family)
MKVVHLPALVGGLIFDLDSTLYTKPEYAAFQEDVLIERLARELGLGVEDARARIGDMRNRRRLGGQGKTSLGNMFAELGFDIATSVRWREEHIEPGQWLEADPELDAALGLLAQRAKLALVTNNPHSVGEKSLAALGVRRHFAVIVGLDDTMKSKPAPEPFALAAARLGLDPAACVSIGDRHDVDLAPALDLGMGAILIEEVRDVYGLPALLKA